jgi:L-lactate dehydrogenase complex protein LldG
VNDAPDAREAILGRIAAALADVPAAEGPDDVVVARGYDHPGGAADSTTAETVLRFAQRVADYRAEVVRIAPEAIVRTLTEACAARGLRRLAIPPGLPVSLRPEGVALIEDRGLTARELDAVDGALTGCAAAIAETGTIVLDGGERSGRRLLTLVPDHHLCIVEAAQIADQVPAALAAVAPAVHRDGRPITLISGPSASSDVELDRVEGVHGPRDLLVVVADPAVG